MHERDGRAQSTRAVAGEAWRPRPRNGSEHGEFMLRCRKALTDVLQTASGAWCWVPVSGSVQSTITSSPASCSASAISRGVQPYVTSGYAPPEI